MLQVSEQSSIEDSGPKITTIIQFLTSKFPTAISLAKQLRENGYNTLYRNARQIKLYFDFWAFVQDYASRTPLPDGIALFSSDMASAIRHVIGISIASNVAFKSRFERHKRVVNAMNVLKNNDPWSDTFVEGLRESFTVASTKRRLGARNETLHAPTNAIRDSVRRWYRQMEIVYVQQEIVRIGEESSQGVEHLQESPTVRVAEQVINAANMFSYGFHGHTTFVLGNINKDGYPARR